MKHRTETLENVSSMRRCPKFDRCRAPICPLDANWRLRTHVSGDTVCYLALEAVKDGADSRLAQRISEETLLDVRIQLPAIRSRWGTINSALDRAALTGSRIDRKAPWQV